MYVRRLSRFRPWRIYSEENWTEFLSPFLAKRVSIILLIALSAMMLYSLQVTWAFQATQQQRHRWVRDLCKPTPMAVLESYWREYHTPPTFTTGDEPAVLQWLQAWPDIQAIHSRQAPFPTWIREGARLRPGDPSRDKWILTSFDQASAGCPGSFWIPPKGVDAKGQFTTILVGENWLVLKRWIRGSQASEAIIRKCTADPVMLRLSFYRYEEKPDANAPYQPWGAWPNLQVDDRRILECRWVSSGWSMFFGEEMVFYYVPTPLFYQRVEAYYHRQILLNSYLYVIVGAVGLLAWHLGKLWMSYRQREADRLAAFTHSLKTPLTAARLRCELLGMDPQVVGDLQEEIIALGEELERLTAGVNNGLRLFNQPQSVGGGLREPISEAWFRKAAADLEPALEAQGRSLELTLCDAEAMACPDTLRLALQTILENALHHGGGMVRLRTSLHGKRFRIWVDDEGPGLPLETPSHLGRISRAPRPGIAPTEGGIGLGLLSRIARDEGWGLELRTDHGSGMQVQLEIHAVRQDHGRSISC